MTNVTAYCDCRSCSEVARELVCKEQGWGKACSSRPVAALGAQGTGQEVVLVAEGLCVAFPDARFSVFKET